MKKTLAKAIIFAVVVGGICYQSGPVYAGEPWTNNGRNIIEIIDKKIEGYDGLKIRLYNILLMAEIIMVGMMSSAKKMLITFMLVM